MMKKKVIKYLGLSTFLITFQLLSLNITLAEVVSDEISAVEDKLKEESKDLLNTSIEMDAIQHVLAKSKNPETIIEVDFDRKKTIPLTLRLFSTTTIVLPERIKSFILGDRVGFWGEIVPDNKTDLVLKALTSGVDTDIKVYGESGTRYVFYIKSINTNSTEKPHFLVYVNNRVIDPLGIFQLYSSNLEEPNLSKKFEIAQKRYDFLETGVDPDKINTKYDILASPGSEDIAPIAVYDNGEFTYFDYRKPFFTGRYPVIYVVRDGYDNLVNREHADGFVIVKTISLENFTIRHGDKVVCVKRRK
ncbi:MAG: TrbG/VirB9 family P-type conjugative transfer protein [Sphingobacteriia bacterium]|nr:TrbG/VirB9 family P-type conjugative transfer protein [Sphingobacteriia bacterium]